MIMSNKKVHFINKNAVRGILESLGGRFVTIDAIKKDGKPTRHNGQLRASPPSHNNHAKLFTIEKSNKGGFRSFKDDRVTRIAGNGVIYAVKSSLATAI
jgi:hypothetical protein